MNDTKFTKGDWRMRACEIGVVDNSDTQSYGMMKVICTLDQYDFTEWNKNAHLIAAAPDMYNLLEEISISMECCHGVDTNKINELLIKARGEIK